MYIYMFIYNIALYNYDLIHSIGLYTALQLMLLHLLPVAFVLDLQPHTVAVFPGLLFRRRQLFILAVQHRGQREED